MEFTTRTPKLERSATDIGSLVLKPYQVRIRPDGHVEIRAPRILPLVGLLIGLCFVVLAAMTLIGLAFAVIRGQDNIQWDGLKGGLIYLVLGFALSIWFFGTKSLRVHPDSKVVELGGVFGRSRIEADGVELAITYTDPKNVVTWLLLTKDDKQIADVAMSAMNTTEVRCVNCIQLAVWLAQTLELPLKVKIGEETQIDALERSQAGALLAQLRSSRRAK